MFDSIFNLEVAPKLSELETQFETPVVPGELADWLQETQQSFSELLPLLQTQIERRHREEFSEITKQDEGLFAQVEQLKHEDQQILKEAEHLSRYFATLSRNGDKLEPEEALANRSLEKKVADGLTLVIRIRKQEAAIGTWLMEAFDRDRGVGD